MARLATIARFATIARLARLAALALIALLTCVAWLAPHAHAVEPIRALGGAFESGARLAEFVERCSAGHLRKDDAAALPALVRDVVTEVAREPEHVRDAVRALLELGALGAAAQRETPEQARARELGRELDPAAAELLQCRAQAATLGRAALRELLGAPSGTADRRVLELLTRECVAGESWAPTQRALAIELVAPHGDGAITLALLSAAAGSSDALRAVALRALAGRADVAVDRYLLGECEASDARTETALLSSSTAHWRARRSALAAPEQQRLMRVCAHALTDVDWKLAAIGAQWSAALSIERAAPLLIEALATWQQRGEQGNGSRRVESALVDTLELLSGRKIGHRLDWWRSWWDVRRKHGDKPAAAPWNDTRAAPRVDGTAQFFGLDLYSDRVTFVLDRSGSMATGLGSNGATRYSTALAQLRECLGQLGERARFNVVVFHGAATAWRARLARATAHEQRNALQWLEGQAPGGATNLEAGLDLLQPRAADGTGDWHELETDTVVVLCDGQAQRPQSIAQWLADNNALGLLRIHCVQLGEAGNGQLEELAQATGGTFRRVAAD